MLVSLYTIVLTAAITAFVIVSVCAYLEHKAYMRRVKQIDYVYFNSELGQLAIMYTNGEFEIKNVLNIDEP